MTVNKIDTVLEHEVELTILGNILINVLRYNDT